MTRYSPWSDLTSREHLDVTIEDLGGDVDAYTVIEDEDASTARRLVLEKRLSQVERRCALAHELAHIDLKHRCHRDGPDAERQSRRDEEDADELAAVRLIDRYDLARSLRIHGEVPLAAAADDLNVTVEILAARLAFIRRHPGQSAWLKAQLCEGGAP